MVGFGRPGGIGFGFGLTSWAGCGTGCKAVCGRGLVGLASGLRWEHADIVVVVVVVGVVVLV